MTTASPNAVGSAAKTVGRQAWRAFLVGAGATAAQGVFVVVAYLFGLIPLEDMRGGPLETFAAFMGGAFLVQVWWEL